MTTYKKNDNGMYALYTSDDYNEVNNSNEWKESASVTNLHLHGGDYNEWFNHELGCITYALGVGKPVKVESHISDTFAYFNPTNNVPEPATMEDAHAIAGDTKPNKYTRTVKGVQVDVYDVLEAFGVTCPALQHLAKKALNAGLRGHKDTLTDLDDIIASAKRAKELELLRSDK